MKRILFLLLLFASAFSYGQVTTQVAQVATITGLKNYNGSAGIVIVTDSATRGQFVLCPGCTADEQFTYAGAGGKKWTRVRDSVDMALIDSKSDADHLHDDRYYTKTQIDDDVVKNTDTTEMLETYQSALQALDAHAASTSNPHSVTKSQVGLGNVDNTSDVNKPVSTATQTALDGKADLVGGKVPSSQIPSIAISDFLGSVDDESEMLALTGQRGDWCVRTDEGKTYILVDEGGDQLGDWVSLPSPSVPVTSVNSQTGDVNLGPSDIGLGNVPNTNATNASNISSGTLDDDRLSSNVPLLDAANSFDSDITIGGDLILTSKALGSTVNGSIKLFGNDFWGTNASGSLVHPFVQSTAVQQANRISFYTSNGRVTSTGNLRYQSGVGMSVNTNADPTTHIDVGASSSSKAQMNFLEGTDPSSPAEGDLWYNGTNLNFRNGASSTIDLIGSVADGRLSANVPLLNAANAFTNNQTINGDYNLILRPSSNSNKGISFTNSSGVERGGIYMDRSTGEFRFGSFFANYFTTLYANNQRAFTLWKDGNAGVGVDTPLAKLHVLSTTEQLRLAYSADAYQTHTYGSTGTSVVNNVGSNPKFNWNLSGTNKIELDVNNAIFKVGILPGTDNAQDIGRTSGPYRFRTGYFATSIGIGVASTPAAPLEILTTGSAHQRWSYDGSNHLELAIASNGSPTFTATGTTPTVTFNTDVNVGGGGTGRVLADYIVNKASTNNGYLLMSNNGVTAYRNIANSQAAFRVFQQHASATGDIQQWHNSSGQMAAISQAGAWKWNAYSTGFLKSDSDGDITSAAITQGDVTDLDDSLATKAYAADLAALIDGMEKTVMLSGDVASSSTSYGDATGLSFPIEANKWYRFEFEVWYNSASTNTGARFAVNGPTLDDLAHFVLVTTSATGVFFREGLDAYDQTALAASGNSMSTKNRGVIRGKVKCSSAGNVILRFSSEVGGSDITIKEGSWVSYQKLN